MRHHRRNKRNKQNGMAALGPMSHDFDGAVLLFGGLAWWTLPGVSAFPQMRIGCGVNQGIACCRQALTVGYHKKNRHKVCACSSSL